MRHPVTEKCWLSPPERPNIEFRKCTSTDVCLSDRDARKLAAYLLALKTFLSDYNEFCKER